LERQNAEETRASINVDVYLMEYIYPYFSNFLDYQINSRTKKYKFKFKFEGTEFTQSREERFDACMTLLDKGIVLPMKIAASLGMEYKDFQRQLDEAKANGWADSLTPILTSATMSGKDLKGGAPVKKNPSDSAIAKRDSGGGDE
jgi:hypothetical protein